MMHLILSLLKKGDYQGSGRQDDGCAVVLLAMSATALVLASGGAYLVTHL